MEALESNSKQESQKVSQRDRRDVKERDSLRDVLRIKREVVQVHGSVNGASVALRVRKNTWTKRL
jgi:hypothetical protein